MIDILGFHGESPKIGDKLLPENYAVLAKNCSTQEGNIKPLKGEDVIQALDDDTETRNNFV